MSSGLIKYEAPSVMSIMKSFFDDDLFRGWDQGLSVAGYPEMDIIEDKESYRVKVDLPGLDKKDIKIELEDGLLSISGEKKEEKIEKDKNRFCHIERSYGSFTRTFRLPDNVDTAGHVDAKYANGVLELTLKKDESAKPKAIEIKVD